MGHLTFKPVGLSDDDLRDLRFLLSRGVELYYKDTHQATGGFRTAACAAIYRVQGLIDNIGNPQFAMVPNNMMATSLPPTMFVANSIHVNDFFALERHSIGSAIDRFLDAPPAL